MAVRRNERRDALRETGRITGCILADLYRAERHKQVATLLCGSVGWKDQLPDLVAMRLGSAAAFADTITTPPSGLRKAT